MAGRPQSDWVTVKVTAGAAAHPDLVSESGTEFVAVPWPAVGLLLVLAGAGATVWALRRRRRAAPEQPQSVPDVAGTH